MNKLEPEVEWGNKEYKRYFKNITKKKLFSFTAQMNWRLDEGDGICYYYIGVNDDGSIHHITEEEFKLSLEIINKMVIECSAKVSDIKNIDNYYIVTIKKNWVIQKLNEYRILLVGDTNTYKTTFLARILKGKDNKKYIVNHKHEMETGDTSSVNYYTLQDEDNKYLLFDSPGNSKYSKTLQRMIENIDYNMVIFFSGKEWDYYEEVYKYFKLNKVTILNIKDIGYYIKKNNFIDIMKKNVSKNINNNISEGENNDIKFNVLQTFYNNEMGILLSGYLMNGEIKVGNILKWKSRHEYNIKVISIHGSNNYDDNNISLERIKGPLIATLCVKSNNVSFNKKLKYGYVYNI
jgi:signal recognition particle receptor subunit beta